jgi:hypothetical protein
MCGCRAAGPSKVASTFTPYPAAGPQSTAPAPPPSRPPAAPTVTPVYVPKGRIASVNRDLRFVVVDFALHALPPLGKRLSVYRTGQKVGEVRISGPSQSSNIAADLTAGEAQVGDEVRED